MRKSVSSIASEFAGWLPGQVVLAVMSSRAKDASVLFGSLDKDRCERLARSYRRGTEPATFKTACVKAVRIVDEKTVEVL
jgi:hypothetical protein